MKKTLIVVAALVATWLAPAAADPASEVLALERQALDGWLTGDPDPQLAVTDPEITYFHAVVDGRLEGLPALKALYAQYRGRPLFDSYEILNPRVQSAGDVAVLTFVLAQHVGSATSHWNATEVYRKTAEGWRIIHSHFSQAAPPQP